MNWTAAISSHSGTLRQARLFDLFLFKPRAPCLLTVEAALTAVSMLSWLFSSRSLSLLTGHSIMILASSYQQSSLEGFCVATQGLSLSKYACRINGE